jgi:hypothetical protein
VKRTKCQIEFLETEEGRISEQMELVQHIEGFYQKLFCPKDRGSVRLGCGVWQEKGRLNPEQKEGLIKKFFMEDVEKAIREMKTKTAPRPDGFPVIFYKKFCGVLKWWIMQIMEDFYKGSLNLSRQNYGIIVLIPKLKEAANIKQSSPICLLIVFYKLFTKNLFIRLMEVAGYIISEN